MEATGNGVGGRRGGRVIGLGKGLGGGDGRGGFIVKAGIRVRMKD